VGSPKDLRKRHLWKQRISKSRSGKGYSPAPKDPRKRHIWRQRLSQSKRGEKNPMFGIGEAHPLYNKKHKQESIEKMRNSHKESFVKDPGLAERIGKACKGRIAWNKNRKLSSEHVENLRKSHKGKHLPLKQKEKIGKASKRLWQTKEYREKVIRGVLKALHAKPNKKEMELLRLLEKDKLPYEYVGSGQLIIAGKNPDFVNTDGQKKIIEFFGDYWHRDDNGVARKGLFARYGYETLIVWEHELLEKEVLLNKIRKFDKQRTRSKVK